MQTFPIHWAAVLVAGAARFVIGFVWYSPLLFLWLWKKAVGLSDEEMKRGMATGMLLHALGSIVMAFVLVHAVHYAGAHGPAQGAAVGFFNWLGFILVPNIDSVTAEKRPLRLLLINMGAALISLLVMGAILAAWV